MKDKTNTLIALRGADSLNPLDLRGYLKQGGCEALRKALLMNGGELVSMVEASGLRGRGGAGFPTGLKWKFALGETAMPKYVIANADEGEPGTFKDRYIMEKAPFRFLEGILIAALAVGAEEGWIYIRHEYTLAMLRLKEAIRLLKEQGFAGDNILGSGRSVELILTSGAGSYLCGDETTLLESMEGKRGNPRYKPPFPAQKGFRSHPTVVNNVETLSHVPDIILHGAEWYRTIGTAGSPGTKLYCLSGSVHRPGVYELPMGTTLRELIEVHGEGIAGASGLKGALLGGAAGTFVDGSMLDEPMDYDNLKNKGATLGSGAVIVIGDHDSIPGMLLNILRFFQHESCGKCVPCRVGCHRLPELMLSIAVGVLPKRQVMDTMVSEASMMAATALCGLGQSPVLPLKSAFRYFSDEF